MSLLLGVDIGTSSSEGGADHSGRRRWSRRRYASTRCPGRTRAGPSTTPATSGGRGSPRSRASCSPRPAARPIAAVGVSGIGPCALPATAGGEPLRPAILYGVDTRAVAEIEELTARYGAEAIIERGGSPLTTQAVGPKLAWLVRNEPEVWARTRRLFMASSYLVHELTGEVRPRPPLGEPELTAVRQPRARLDRRLGGGDRPGPGTAAARLARRGRGHGHRGRIGAASVPAQLRQ